jgi:hypothetical protein
MLAFSPISCRFLEIDPKAWAGVEKTAASSDPKHHIGAVRIEPNEYAKLKIPS